MGGAEQRITLGAVIGTYGGWKAFVKSRFVWLAILLLVPTWKTWSQPGWWDTVLSVVPNLLGFTLAGFTMSLAVGDDAYRRVLAEAGTEDGGPSVMESVVCTFFVFIAVQVVSLLAAICFKGMWAVQVDATLYEILLPIGWGLWGLSYFLFLYGIVLAVATAKWLLTLAMGFIIGSRS